MVGHGGEGSGVFRSEYATGLGRRRFVEDLGLVEAALVETNSSAAGQSGSRPNSPANPVLPAFPSPPMRG